MHEEFIQKLLKGSKDERRMFWDFVCLYVFNIAEEVYELRKENAELKRSSDTGREKRAG
jgi:hypothetical protein